MRRAHVVAGVGLAVLVASCSGKPNDLRHYGTQAPETTTSSASPPTTTAPTTTTATVDPNALRLRAGTALLTDQVVLDIGFHHSQNVTEQLPTCSATLAQVTGAQAGWVGATSVTTLTEAVAAYGEGMTGAQMLSTVKHALVCTSYRQGEHTYKVTPNESLPKPAGVDSFYAWCETSGTQVASCSVLMAKGTMLARVQVATTAENKAKTLIGDVTPPAAVKLVAGS